VRTYKGLRVFEGYALGKLKVYETLKVEKTVGLGMKNSKDLNKQEKKQFKLLINLLWRLYQN
jgi:hypothetical protein